MSFYFFADVENLDIQTSDAFGTIENAVIDGIEYEQFLVTDVHSSQAPQMQLLFAKDKYLFRNKRIMRIY